MKGSAATSEIVDPYAALDAILKANRLGVDANGNIHLEGTGVVPTVRVPVTEETLFAEGDPILEAAINHLNNTIGGQ